MKTSSRMNILFLTISRFTDITARGIYPDLLREFAKEGHNVYVVSPRERRFGVPTGLTRQEQGTILGVKTLNLQKTNVIEKGLGTVLMESQFKSAIKKYLKGMKWDLILYSTPPITFPKVIKYLKRENPSAKTYLLLKDIFPQNAVDLGMFSKKSLIYKYFRRKEKELYRLSDHIGCMSPANVRFVCKHNPEVFPAKVEVAPNCIEPVKQVPVDRDAIRQKYGLPTDRPVFIYGGNLGKPQGIDFLIRCLDENANRENCFFLVIGTGTELPKLKKWYQEKTPASVKVMDGIPKNEYDVLVQSCDVGLIFLDHRFTIPNYPSRLLPYLENRMPVLCVTDPNTDIGRIAEENGYGLWCESDSVERFTITLERMFSSDIAKMGEAGYRFLCDNYLVQNTYSTIMSHYV